MDKAENHFIGIDDSEFIRGDVPMTKQGIRIMTMVKARIKSGDIVYDIGAGTGSLSIEAALLASGSRVVCGHGLDGESGYCCRKHEGHVYAIERNKKGVDLIKANIKKFAVDNITVINGTAPDALKDLPPCDAVLIGGSGGELTAILDTVKEKLNSTGRIVLNCITIQTLAAALDYFRKNSDTFTYEAIEAQISYLQAVGPYDMAKADNPIYIITAQKII